MRTKSTIVSLLLCASVSVSGCGLVDPYAKWERPAADEVTALENITLPYAIAYAQNARDAYRDKLSDHAILTNSAAPALITLSAITLGLAAYGAHTDTILGAGLVGGTGYTLANWFSNPTQELVYLAGMKGMSCAVDAVLPLNFSEPARMSLDSDIRNLNHAIGDVNQAIAKVQSQIPLFMTQSSELSQQAGVEVTKAEKIVETADQTYVAGAILLRHIDTVGTDLVMAVDRIDVAVDTAVQQTQPRLESIVNVIAQLSDATNIFAPGLGLADTLAGRLQPGVVEQAADFVDEDTLTSFLTDISDLASKSATLASLTRRVAGVVNSVNEKRPLETLKDCGVEVDEVSTDIAVAPAQLQFNVGTVSEKMIIVKGGKSPYVAQFRVSPTPGIVVQNPIPGDHTIVVKATEGATAGIYTLYIFDAAKHSKTVTVTVLGAMAGGAIRDRPDGATVDEATLQELAIDIENKPIDVIGAPEGAVFTVTLAQADLGASQVVAEVSVVPADTAWPDDDAIKTGIGNIKVGETAATVAEKYADRINLDKVLSIERRTDGDEQAKGFGETLLPKVTVQELPAAHGGVVAGLTLAEVVRIQNALCLTKLDGDWGDKTQMALVKWRNNVEGPLNTVEKAQLLTLSRVEISAQCSAGE